MPHPRLSRRNLGPRARSMSMRAIKREVKAAAHESTAPVVERPQTREECRGTARPCLWISCKHNLYLDVSPETGSLKFNFPDLEPGDMPADQSCSLDIAERGALTLESVALALNITRERARQLEVIALLKLAQSGRVEREDLGGFARPAGHVEDDVSGIGTLAEDLAGYRPEGRR